MLRIHEALFRRYDMCEDKLMSAENILIEGSTLLSFLISLLVVVAGIAILFAAAKWEWLVGISVLQQALPPASGPNCPFCQYRQTSRAKGL